MEKKFEYKGDGYLLIYQVAIDNSVRMEFFKKKELAEQYVKEKALDKAEYIGITGIFRIAEYYEWL